MKYLVWAPAESRINTALLIMRIGLGAAFIVHGYPKITGDAEMWEALGGSMKNIGIDFAPQLWGFLAAVAEFFGGILLIIGFLTRVAAFGMMFTMIMATISHFSGGDDFNTASHAIEMAVAFLFLLIAGGGRYSVDSRLQILAK